MDDNEKYMLKLELEKEQHDLNIKYRNEGLTDEVLDKQVELNRLRNKYDIPDDLEEKLHEDFVQ